jgi:hypothetical protein
MNMKKVLGALAIAGVAALAIKAVRDTSHVADLP